MKVCSTAWCILNCVVDQNTKSTEDYIEISAEIKMIQSNQITCFLILCSMWVSETQQCQTDSAIRKVQNMQLYRHVNTTDSNTITGSERVYWTEFRILMIWWKRLSWNLLVMDLLLQFPRSDFFMYVWSGVRWTFIYHTGPSPVSSSLRNPAAISVAGLFLWADCCLLKFEIPLSPSPSLPLSLHPHSVILLIPPPYFLSRSAENLCLELSQAIEAGDTQGAVQCASTLAHQQVALKIQLSEKSYHDAEIKWGGKPQASRSL